MSLSKTRYVSGLQCQKKLWWEVHEPDAPELVPDAGLEAIFTLGHHVGDLARTYVPGGLLIDIPYYKTAERVEATARAIDAGERVIYEASFIADQVFASIDILERTGNTFTLTEVKATKSVKDTHIPDVAIQLHVARRSGLAVDRAEVMHLNRACRHPDLSNLFLRENVTPLLDEPLRDVPARIHEMHTMLDGPRPEIAPGPHCSEPYDCPFISRCWPELPEHHISTLYRSSAKMLASFQQAGYKTLHDLPDDFEAKGPRMRQIQSIRQGRVIVEPGLGAALQGIEPPIAFLDFETIAPAVPVWPGCAPYDPVPVQFSCHVLDNHQLTHHAWLADGPADPREPFARAMIDACAGARTVLAYHASTERGHIRKLATVLPHLAPQLTRLAACTHDLLAIVRNHVYHPDFGGGFSIKQVLPALVPGLGYDDLEIQDGQTASRALEALLLGGETLSAEQRQTLRDHLLRYCETDTLAMVRLLERLREMAGSG